MDWKEASRYLKKVKYNCPYPFRKKLIPELQGALEDFLDENPDGTMVELVAHFGVPETFGYNYISAMEDAERQRWIKQSRQVKGIVLAVVATCVFTVAVWVGCNIWWNSEHAIRSYEVWVEYDDTGERIQALE
ncbi:MAG: hypothetical protein K2P87_01425 [Lachnospiraceae bacterium]|nr:hypothetical protein [Lachnospiraceae bacterium]